MKIMKEFQKFINKGNIIDLSVAVVIGTAFGKIVSSFVRDIITPIISLFMGSVGFSNYKYVILESDPVNGIQENAIYYGIFIQSVLDFLIVAFVIFLFIKMAAKAKEVSKDVKDSVSEIVTENKSTDLLADIKILLAENLKK